MSRFVTRHFNFSRMTSTCEIASLDHFVLTVKDVQKSVEFYTKVLGMKEISFGPNGERKALQFGSQKINLHQVGKEFKPHARNPKDGSGDICFVSPTPLAHWQNHLSSSGIDVEEGPVPRTGAVGPINSIYVRDPDGNLVEIANY